MSTEKQKLQQKRFRELGDLVGTACWISTKTTAILQTDGLTHNQKFLLDYHTLHLRKVLLEIAEQKGYKQLSPTP